MKRMKCGTRVSAFIALLFLALGFLTSTAPLVQAASGTLLHTFRGGLDGSYPDGSVSFDAAGNLYGTTQIGGSYGAGTVFQLLKTPDGGWHYYLLYVFTGGVDGANPLGSLVFDAAGNAYATAAAGGANGLGCVYELIRPANAVPGKKWDEKVLYSFQGGSDGATPFGNLVFDPAGSLYGTTSIGGVTHLGCLIKGCGTIFRLSPAGSGWQETVLHSFRDAFSEGATPVTGLTFDAAGNLYGTTYEGGNNTLCNGYGCGTVFELRPGARGHWHLDTLLDFDIKDGALPEAGVTLDGKGNLYGATGYGGEFNDGAVFSLTNATGHWKKGSLYSFGAFGIRSFRPSGTLALDGAGNLYGTTCQGGPDDSGTVFQLVPDGDVWTMNFIYSFDVTGQGLGENPLDGVTLDGAGNLYLTTNQGGNLNDCQPNAGCGTVLEFEAVASEGR